MEIVLGMPFLSFSNGDVQFAEKKLTWRTYTTEKALPTTCRVEIIDQKKFAKAVLDENVEAFIVYVSSLGSKISIYLARKAQLALLQTKKVTVPTEYLDFTDIFSEKSANVFFEQTGANEYAIELEEGKQPPYGPIYSLRTLEFETIKTYIKINLANGLIWAPKSPVGAAILLICKLNGSLCLCVNY